MYNSSGSKMSFGNVAEEMHSSNILLGSLSAILKIPNQSCGKHYSPKLCDTNIFYHLLLMQFHFYIREEVL